MYDVVYDFKRLAERNHDGSYVTQAQRKSMLMMIGNQLVELGWRHMRATDFKGRHVHALLKLWKGQEISDRTIANRLSCLRWLLEKIDRVSVMPKTNEAYHLAARPSAATTSKAITLDEDILAQVIDPYVQMSLRLQQQWGLRREESIKIRVWQADAGDHLTMQGSWCKNGRAREIPLVWPAQRDVLEQAKHLVRFKSHSLIPQHLQYHQQRNVYDAWARKLDLPPLHGLRHCFAQRRFAMLTGFVCPVLGGPPQEAMTPDQQALDAQARDRVSAELGHGRRSVTRLYLG